MTLPSATHWAAILAFFIAAVPFIDATIQAHVTAKFQQDTKAQGVQ